MRFGAFFLCLALTVMVMGNLLDSKSAFQSDRVLNLRTLLPQHLTDLLYGRGDALAEAAQETGGFWQGLTSLVCTSAFKDNTQP